MKKALLVILILVVVIGGGAWYLLSGAGDFIRAQIESQGSKYLSTTVSVDAVDLSLSDERLSIAGVNIKNPEGFSNENAFSLNGITLALGQVLDEPYEVKEITVDAPEILYEVNENGEGNLLVLKNNLEANLPTQNSENTQTEDGANPLVKVNQVSVRNAKLHLNFEKLNTGELKIDKKDYEITLPTFEAGAIGQPDGLPADQVGAAIVKQMLDNVIREAKAEAKKVLADKAKEKVNEKINEEKDKLMEKANDKLKGLFNKDN